MINPNLFKVPQLRHRKLKYWDLSLAKPDRGDGRTLRPEGGRHHLDRHQEGHPRPGHHLGDHHAGQTLDHLSDHPAGGV